jgi:AcrR family transcriptional regulator
VLDAALELFVQRGYEGTSMDAIAAAAGVTKPVVYSCYPSKEELFAALLLREEARVLEQIAAALPDSPEVDDPAATLIYGFTGFLRAVSESPETYRVILLGEGGVNAAIAGRIRRGREQQVEAVAALARRWIQGRHTRSDPEATARLLGNAVVGLAEAGARALLSDPQVWTAESLGRVLGGLAARGQSAIFAEPGADRAS